jgi:nicotinamidase-related amidase
MENFALERLRKEHAALLVVDLQDRLVPAMHNQEAIAAAIRMTRAAKLLELPILVTEQYPAGLGATVPELQGTLPETTTRIGKLKFSAFVPGIEAQLKAAGRKSVIVVGIEAHVCVQQTVLDLLRADYRVYVCGDAITSRKPVDAELAVARMRQAGAIMTSTESVIFDLVDEAGTDLFKQMLKVVK